PQQGDSTPMPSDLSTPNTSGIESLIEMAKKDLAHRLSVSMDEINLIDARSVVWPNASLGCPQDGMFYAEVLTPGYLILLSAGNLEFEYHAGSSTEVVHCENPSPPV